MSITGGNTPVAIRPSQPWLAVSPSSGVTPLQVAVTANPAGLAPGKYVDDNFLVITSTQTIVVPITLTVNAIEVAPQSLSFFYNYEGSSYPQAQTLAVTGQNLDYTVSESAASGGNWLSAVARGNQVNVTVDPAVLDGLGPATYQGTVTIGQAGAAPVVVPVTLTVVPGPAVTILPTTVNLSYQIGGENNVGIQQPTTLSTTSTSALQFVFGAPEFSGSSAGANWISVDPSSGTIPAEGSAQSVVSYEVAANLPPGSYSASIPATAVGGDLSEAALPVNLVVSNNPVLIVPQDPLTFSYNISTGAQPRPQNVTPQSSAVAASSVTGQMAIVASAATSAGGAWLAVSPTANLTTGTAFAVSANPASLAAGTYSGTITVAPVAGAAAGNGAQTIPVTLTVADNPAILSSASYLSFAYQTGQRAPMAQTVNLSSNTGEPLAYSIAAAETTCNGVNWLTLNGGPTGVTNGSFAVAPSGLASLGAGTCTGAITVAATDSETGVPAAGSPLSIPVTLYVSGNPMLLVTPPALSFSLPVGGSGGSQQIAVTSTSATLAYNVALNTAAGGVGWLAATPTSGSSAQGGNAIDVSVTPGSLTAGTYSGSVVISSLGVADSPVTVPITLQLTSSSLTLSPTAVNFTYIAGEPNPPPQTVQVTGSAGAVNYVANSGAAGTNWLSVASDAYYIGTAPTTLQISANPANLAPGVYTGTVTVTSPNAANSPAVIAVTLTVSAGAFTATPAPATPGAIFTLAAGATAPAAENISLSASATTAFTASAAASSGGNWLSATASSGATPATVTISVSAASLSAGSYSGTVTISAPGASFVYSVLLQVVTPVPVIATPTALNFSHTLGGPAPAAQAVTASLTPNLPYSYFGPGFGGAVSTSSGGSWLTVANTLESADLGSPILVSVDPTGLAAGTYTGLIMIGLGNNVAYPPATVTVALVITAALTPAISAVVNAASYLAAPVTPGEEVAIFGTNFGPPGVVGATPVNNEFPATLSNAQILFDGVPAPIIAAADGQVNAMVPYGVAGQASTAVQVSYFGLASATFPCVVAAAVPGIYTLNQSGSGGGAILNQDFSVNGPDHPAAIGSVISIYLTGGGVTSPASTTGGVAPVDGTGLNSPTQTVTAAIGGVNAPVQYAGSAPGLVYGVMQVNAVVPAGVAAGAQPIVITVGSVTSQSGVTVTVQ